MGCPASWSSGVIKGMFHTRNSNFYFLQLIPPSRDSEIHSNLNINGSLKEPFSSK